MTNATTTDLKDFMGDLGGTPAPTMATQVVGVPPTLLALCFCRDVARSVAEDTPELTLIGMRYRFAAPAFPATLDTGMVAAVWRLPPGSYVLEVGLLDSDQTLLAVDQARGELASPAIHTSLHKLGQIAFPAPGMYWLAARQNQQVVSFQPIEIAQEK